MEDNFDNQIKNLLEGSQSDGAGLGLDKNALWNRVEQKQKTKIIPFKKWASHAAAAIIGIIICLPFLFNNNKTVTKTITRLQPANTKIITDTVFLKDAPALVSGKATPLQARTQQPLTGNPAPASSQPVPTTIHLANYDTTEVLTQPIFVAQVNNSHTRIKALHLKDMGNENATHQFRPVDKPNFIERLALRDQIQAPSESVSAIIDQQFFTSNN